MHGCGTKTNSDGDHYEGRFSRGLENCLGALTSAGSGILYEGEFMAD